jgi:hypothetical protein
MSYEYLGFYCRAMWEAREAQIKYKTEQFCILGYNAV